MLKALCGIIALSGLVFAIVTLPEPIINDMPMIICESQELTPSHEPYTYGTMTCNVGSVSGPEVTVVVID